MSKITFSLKYQIEVIFYFYVFSFYKRKKKKKKNPLVFVPVNFIIESLHRLRFARLLASKCLQSILLRTNYSIYRVALVLTLLIPNASGFDILDVCTPRKLYMFSIA